MSVGKTSYRITLWDNKVLTPEETQAIAMQLAAFVGHKEALLDKLRQAHKQGSTSKPFDSKKSWRDLTCIADLYLSADRMKQDTMSAGTRVKRLGELANVLGRACRLTVKAMQDDVGADLFRALAAERNITSELVVRTGSTDASRLADEMKEMVEGLAALERAASTATKQVSRERGRPKGTSVLSPDCIIRLARAYRNSTGSKPGAGSGPFARFVCEFLGAVGRFNLTSASVIDAIKDARAQSLAANRGGPSPFV